MGFRFLTVDDEIVSRTKMQTLLTPFGDCQVAESGHAAIDCFQSTIAQKESFDLVTLDINMPDMDGEKVLKAIREIENQNNIPTQNRTKILMVTCEANKERVLLCHAAGCDDYIIKPFNIHTLQLKMEQFGFVKIEGQTYRIN
jgi:two-component system, chemotaxis family, chemotaxis protein CheY